MSENIKQKGNGHKKTVIIPFFVKKCTNQNNEIDFK